MALFIHSGIGFYAFGVFFTPIEKEFGWSRATISAAMSIGALISGFASPLVGRWTETLGPRKVMIAGALVMATGLVALYGVSTLWQLYAFFMLAVVGRMGLSTIPVGTVLGRWFRHRRGLAFGIAATGIGIGGLMMAPLAEFLIASFGWRPAIAILGAIVVAVVVPLVIIWIRGKPEEMGLQRYGEAAEDESKQDLPTGAAPADRKNYTVTFQQALRTPAFWMISAALFFISLGQGSVLLHLVPFFQDRGESSQVGATVLAFVGGMGGVGKFFMGYISDRFPPRFVMLTCFLLQGLGMVVLLLPASPLTIPAFVVFYGMGMGGVYALQPIIAAETFGLGSLGTVIGCITLSASVSQSFGPILTGYIYDTTKSYTLAFMLFITLAVLASFSIFRARPVVDLMPKVDVARS